MWRPRARRKIARGGAGPRAMQKIARGGVSPRARRRIARGGRQPSSEAEYRTRGRQPSSMAEYRLRGAAARVGWWVIVISLGRGPFHFGLEPHEACFLGPWRVHLRLLFFKTRGFSLVIRGPLWLSPTGPKSNLI
jgi:hypothetical protein